MASSQDRRRGGGGGGQGHQWKPVSRGGGSSSSSSSSSMNNNMGSRDAELGSLRQSQGGRGRVRGVPFSRSIRAMPPRGREENGGIQLVPYLPQDDAVAVGLSVEEGGVDVMETQSVADLLNEELAKLLKMNDSDFWESVTTNDSIQVSLDSYLQFRRRWYDIPTNYDNKAVAGVIVGEHDLSRRVFMVLYRLLHYASSNNSRIASSSSQDDGSLLREKRFLDVAKLLDVCAIYGRRNPKLTRQLVGNAFQVVPELHEDLAGAIQTVLQRINTMRERLSSVMVEYFSEMKSGACIGIKLQQEFLEVVDYLSDMAITLDALICSYPPAAIMLVSGDRNRSVYPLLPTLSVIHDQMLPLLWKGLSRVDSSATSKHNKDSQLTTDLSIGRLRIRFIDLAWHLLSTCYMVNESKTGDEALLFTLKSHEGANQGTVMRGDSFMQDILGMAMNCQNDKAHLPECLQEWLIGFKSLLISVDKKYKLLEEVEKSLSTGMLILDQEQYNFLCELLRGRTEVQRQPPLVSHLSDKKDKQEQDILRQSKVSHIKDILPGYEDGFLARCLEAYDDNVEDVIQRLLEGSIHEDIFSAEAERKATAHNVPVPPSLDGGKGKEKVVETGLTYNKRASGKGKQNASSEGASEDLIRRLTSSSSSSSGNSSSMSGNASSLGGNAYGRFIRKDKGEGDTMRVMDERDEKGLLRTMALASQYDDEYDDEYDESRAHVADGMEETENLIDSRAFPTFDGNSFGDKMHSGYKTPASRGPQNQSNEGSHNMKQNTSSFVKGNWQNVTPNWESEGSANRSSGFSSTKGQGRDKKKEEAKPQFYVKDGKNYSYKVQGAVAVSSAEEAEALVRDQEETIYGLGRGGNVPLRSIENGEAQQGPNIPRGRGAPPAHGRGRRNFDPHHRKDRAAKKHFNSLTGL